MARHAASGKQAGRFSCTSFTIRTVALFRWLYVYIHTYEVQYILLFTTTPKSPTPGQFVYLTLSYLSSHHAIKLSSVHANHTPPSITALNTRLRTTLII